MFDSRNPMLVPKSSNKSPKKCTRVLPIHSSVCIARRTPIKHRGCRMSNNRRLASGQAPSMQQAKQSKQFLLPRLLFVSVVLFSSKLSALPVRLKGGLSVRWLVVVSINHSITAASRCCYCVFSTGPFCCERVAALALLHRLLRCGKDVHARRSMRYFGV